MNLSIIIPVYNAKQYLRECIESALRQTIKDKEILCIDDGSNDGSFEILKDYEKNYKEIKVFSQENQGAGTARNLGLREAKGKFVCFLDADDYYIDSDALEKMFRVCIEQKIEICGGFRQIKTERGIEKFELHRNLNCGEEGKMVKFQDYQDDFYYQNYIFSAQLLKAHNIQFPIYRRYQDPPFFLKAMIYAQNFWVIPTEFYCYRGGHQNWTEYNKKIGETLHGIRDCMKLSYEQKYEILQEKLLGRIKEYETWILKYCSWEIYMTLLEIRGFILNYENAKIIEDIIMEPIVKLDRLVKEYDYLKSSHLIYNILLSFHQNKVSIANYLKERGVNSIAIYGLGNFGELFYREISESEVEIKYGIDEVKKEFKDIQVISPNDAFFPCDLIVISPLREGMEIKEKLMKETPIRVITLMELILEVEKGVDI